ncbi:DNA polymerase I, partial [Paenibacillus larvae]
MQKRKAAGVNETPEEAFERIGAMALTPKQRIQFDAALAAFRSGEIGSLRTDGKRWTKSDVLLAGARILQKRKEVERGQRISEVLASKPGNFHILTHDSELPAFVDRLRTECKRQMTEWAGKFDFLGVKSMTAGDFE